MQIFCLCNKSPKGGVRVLVKPGLHSSPSNRQRTSRQPSCSSSAEVPTQGGGGGETGPKGVCCIIQTSGRHAHGSRSSGTWSNLGGGWQAYCTRTGTAVHCWGWKGSYWSSSSLCNIIQAPSNTRCRMPPQTPHPFRCLSAPPADGCPPGLTPHPLQKIHKFKQGRKGKKEQTNKKNQDHFRAVQIGGSAGCRSNQLMQLSWRPPVDHLPGSWVAVVAVSAGLTPRGVGPLWPGGSHLPSPRLFVPHAAGASPGASPLPDSLWGMTMCGWSQPGLSGRIGQLCFIFCRVFARSPLPPHKPVVFLEHLCACMCLGFTWCACRETGISPVLQGGVGTLRNWWHPPHPTGLPQGWRPRFIPQWGQWLPPSFPFWCVFH